ncbi:spermine oxidase-like [Lytechinus pictus]|uniref:spermine oxidase-like n=1 Tax=Lytechinus pictus TaxID=7653 RepID=UPI0030BA1C8E
MAGERRKVVIVGAGMAGLSAGVELCKSGCYDVTILEAMPTCGGRIQTLKGFGSRAIELGANWLHGTKGSPVYELAKTHDLLSYSDDSSSSSSDESVSSPSYSSIFDENEAKWYNYNSVEENQFRTESGECIDTKLVVRAKKMYADALDKKLAECEQPEVDIDQRKCLDEAVAQGFAEELKQHGVISDTKEYRQYWLMYEHCCRMECMDIGSNTLQDVQLRSYVNYEELEGDYYTTLGRKGYQGILEKLLVDIPANSIHYNTPVSRIQYAKCHDTNDVALDYEDDSVVMVTCEDGRTFLCNHVIVTASIGFLKENVETLFQPPLPEDKLDAIRIFPYGTVNKIFMKYKRPFWTSEDFGLQVLWDSPNKDESEEEEKEKFYRMLTGFDVEDKNDDILLGWVYGRGADYMETMTDEETGQRCTAILRKFLNDPSIPEPEKVLCTRWNGNRFQRGSYGAFLPVEGSGKEIEAFQRPVYSQRTRHGKKVPVLLFAGEACHESYFSTTHGAMVSGMDQAKVLIKFSSTSE